MGHTDRPMAGRLQLVHKSDSVCVLQQEVQTRFRRDYPIAQLLRTTKVKSAIRLLFYHRYTEQIILYNWKIIPFRVLLMVCGFLNIFVS